MYRYIVIENHRSDGSAASSSYVSDRRPAAVSGAGAYTYGWVLYYGQFIISYFFRPFIVRNNNKPIYLCIHEVYVLYT